MERPRILTAVLLIGLSAILLTGRSLHIPLFEQPVVGVLLWHTSTALAIMLCGIGEICISRGMLKTSKVLAVFICCLAFTECLSPITTLSLLSIALSLALYNRRYRQFYLGEAAAYLVLLASLVAMVGYAFEMRPFYHFDGATYLPNNLTVMPFFASMMLFITSLSLIGLHDEHWFYRWWTRDSRSGEVARLCLPIFIGLPLAAGFCKTFFDQTDLVAEELCMSLIIVAMISAAAIALSRLSAKFDRLDEEHDRIMQQRQDFLFAMAHDIKAPLLGSDRIIDQILAGRVKDVATQMEYLTMIREGNENLIAGIQNLLHRYRQENGLNSTALESSPLHPLIESCVQQMRPMVEGKNLQLIYKGSARGLSVQMDDDTLRRMLVNLIHNASKFTSEGSIEIDCKATDSEVFLKVKDSGIGISEECLADLFDNASRTAEGQQYASSSGLGLHFSKKIMHSYGGDLTCESKPGQGATFIMQFPRNTTKDHNS